MSVGSSPLANVAFSATNGVTCTTSDASGQYRCTVPQGWSGTVTPSSADTAFVPVSRSYANLAAAQTAQDYAASIVYEVSGSVTLNGLPLADVAIAAAGVTCATTNAWGQYTCTLPAGWSGTMTPSAAGYSFSPSSRSYTTLEADQPAQSFAATLDTATAPLYFIHADHLNTPRLIADSAGTTIWKWDQQEPFGNNVPDENPSGLGVFDLPLRLPGQYFDRETNLHYNYLRDCYDPGTGRYCQSDPIGLRGGLNTYAYVSNNPLAWTDRLGLQADA